MKNKKTLILTTAVCLLPLIAGAIVYQRLPATVATHFDLHGEPDGWSSRAFAVFGLPGILLLVNLFVPSLLRADPKHENMSSALQTLTVWTIPVVSLICSGATLSCALGYPFPIERVLPVFLGILFLLIGNYLPKTKQSYTMGIKLPWTLHSEENWNRTHRLAGFLWVLCGLFFIVVSFIGWTLPLLLVPLVLMVLVPTVYSYCLYRRGI